MKNKLLVNPPIYAILLMALIALNSCKNRTNQPAGTDSANIQSEIITEDIWIIEEHEINDIALTSKSPKAKDTPLEKKTSSTVEKEIAEAEIKEDADTDTQEAIEAEKLEEEAYEIATLAMFTEMIAEEEYIAENTYKVEEAVIPLEENQTIVSFSKKGKPEDAFQVVTNLETDEIEQIIFTDKRHTDEYDVSAGMTAKEVKKLRRELKHIVHKGKVFLYDDSSNVMYLMDAENIDGEEITAEDIDSMEVSAIIWKDKKHHKNMN